MSLQPKQNELYVREWRIYIYVNNLLMKMLISNLLMIPITKLIIMIIWITKPHTSLPLQRPGCNTQLPSSQLIQHQEMI